MSDLHHVQPSPIARRDFVQRMALAGGGLTVAAAAGCGAAGGSGVSEAVRVAENIGKRFRPASFVDGESAFNVNRGRQHVEVD